MGYQAIIFLRVVSVRTFGTLFASDECLLVSTYNTTTCSIIYLHRSVNHRYFLNRNGPCLKQNVPLPWVQLTTLGPKRPRKNEAKQPWFQSCSSFRGTVNLVNGGEIG